MKVDRLVSIIIILLDKKRVSAKELAEMFEVSLRTIYRDIDAINMAGIPVRGEPGVGGGFEIMEGYKIDKKVFSSDDLSAILMGLSGFSSLMQGDALARALAKVRSVIPADRAKDIELKASQIHIDLSSWMGNQDVQRHLEIIKRALEEHRLLQFEYYDRYGNKTVRTAEPCQLVLKSGHWYVHGYCRNREDFRLFRLSRMAELQMQEETFLPREHEKPQLDFAGMAADLQTEIRIRIHRSAVDRALEYCTYDHFEPDGSEHYMVRFPFIENDYYYNILLGFGAGCQCLEPPHVREEMRRRIQDMAALYEG